MGVEQQLGFGVSSRAAVLRKTMNMFSFRHNSSVAVTKCTDHSAKNQDLCTPQLRSSQETRAGGTAQPQDKLGLGKADPIFLARRGW